MAHYAVAPCVGQKLTAIAHQSARRYIENQANTSLVFVNHVVQNSAPRSEFFHNRAHVFLRDVDCQLLDGLKQMPLLVALHYYFRAGNCKFEVLPAHGFDKNRQMQLTPAADFESIG